jgi:predicted ATPase
MLAQSVHDPALLVEAHSALGNTLFFLGELGLARKYEEQGIALYDPQKHHAHTFLYGMTDPGVICLSYTAWILWHLGYLDQALEKTYETLSLAQKLSHYHSQAMALNHTALHYQLRREGRAVQERAEAAITLSSEQGFPFWAAQGTLFRGWALTEEGRSEEGIIQIRQGLAAWRATGAELVRPYFLALLAEAYGNVGQIEEGLAALADALAQVEETGERFYEAELHRLKGELSLKSAVRSPQSTVTNPRPLTPDPQGEAEVCFHQAIAIARRQSAKSLELRAVISLSRLWQQQGKRQEAHELLAEIYGWFTEGFDTKDLQEAKTLLEELGH